MHRLNKLIIISIFVFISKFSISSEVSQKYYDGMEAFEQGKYKKSISIFKKILKKEPDTSDLGKIQAQIGKAYEHLEKYKKAFDAYETIFKKYPDYEGLEEVVEREYKIGEKFASGEMKSLLGIDFAESNKTALDIFLKVVKHFPYGELADEALLKAIKIIIEQKNYDKAEEIINKFKKSYENSPFFDEVHYLAGYNYYLQIKEADYDQSNTKTAIEKFKYYIEVFPTGNFREKAKTFLKDLNDRECEQKFNTAVFYLKKNNSSAAKNYFNDIINNYPESLWAKKAQEKLLQL